ncbi:MAG: TIGR04282 family arsenosugar biosynthesis glycosyltransferase, partial [Deltaproteobacteria bacterium]|nr:TIGR04282 family arsenosugar biosynthesis glycosyltransferase [Deltaproteobacteria bacterium]
MTYHNKLIIFTRYPEPGSTKTRLIGALGANGAAELHRQMAELVVGVARELKSSTGIAIEIRFVGGDDSKMRQWLGNDMEYAGQIGQDLGERMDNAFKAGFDRGCDRIVVVGSDCPELTADILKEAFHALDHHSVVLGPASDGGYYLVGLKQLISNIFHNIPWGTENVLEETRKALSSLEVSNALLER